MTVAACDTELFGHCGEGTLMARARAAPAAPSRCPRLPLAGAIAAGLVGNPSNHVRFLGFRQGLARVGRRRVHDIVADNATSPGPHPRTAQAGGTRQRSRPGGRSARARPGPVTCSRTGRSWSATTPPPATPGSSMPPITLGSGRTHRSHRGTRLERARHASALARRQRGWTDRSAHRRPPPGPAALACISCVSLEYPPLVYGGLGRHVRGTGPGSGRAGHDVTVVTQTEGDPPMRSSRSARRALPAATGRPGVPADTMLAWVRDLITRWTKGSSGSPGQRRST